MSQIRKSDVRRIVDALERGEDWRAMVRQFPYHLREELEVKVVDEHDFRRRMAAFGAFSIEEKEQLFIDDKIAEKYGCDIDLAFERYLEHFGKTQVLKAREKKRKQKAAEEDKKQASRKERERKRWASVFPVALICWILMIAFLCYLTNMLWSPEWGIMAKGNLYVIKIAFCAVLALEMFSWCFLFAEHLSKKDYVLELVYSVSALCLTYEVLYHVIHTKWGCIFFFSGAALVWVFAIFCQMSKELRFRILMWPPIFGWCAIYAFAICGKEQCWGPEREAWKEATQVVRYDR